MMKQKSAPVVLLVLFALLVMATGSASSPGFDPS
jgi:hypothetical protein